MRTTLHIDDRLLQRAKETAAQRGTTLRRVVEDALRAALSPKGRQKPFNLQWKTRRGRIVGGADPDDRDVLYDQMEGRR